MERHFVSAIVLAAMFATGGAVKAEEFLIIGPRQMGMGGAGVATTRGSLGTYWNPATLAPPRAPRVDSYFDIALHATASGAATENALREVQDVVNLLDGIDFDGIGDTLEGGDALTPEQVNDILRLAQEIPDLGKNGRGLIASLAPGIQLRVGNWGFSAMGLVYAAGNANIDTAFLSLGNQGLGNVITGNDTPATPGGQAFAGELAGLLADRGLDAGEANRVANEIAARGEDAGVDFADEGFRDFLLDIVDATVAAEGEPVDPNEFFSGNRSGVDVRGIVLQEYAVSYAQPLLGIVSVGATGKILYGRTYFNPFTLEDLETFGDVLDEFTTGLDEDQFNFAFDLGILVQPIEQVSVGLVGKYLNSPSFDFPGGGSYNIQPQVRAGVALGPFGGFTFAADLDLYANSSEALPGYDTQFIGGGIEYNVADTLFLRGGLSKNLAEPDEQILIHAGLGLYFFGVSLDVAGMIAPEFVEIDVDEGGDATEIPERAGVSVLVSLGVPLF